MEIGFPSNVRHIAHVTFDRLQGFLGLPIEFELEVPRRVPSASASAFGVSADSMQCSYDAYGNSVPTILLLLQERLYEQGGLKTEGIFRINPENSEEEQLRDQLNKGIVPYDIDVHCLAGLIKAWFRELPKGVLDSLSPEQVLQCDTEDQCTALIMTLPPTQAALFDWAINLMADVVHEEACNKMNARNIAVVFAPNMIQMLDPLTALKHAVQVMNLLKMLILKNLKDRERSVVPTGLVAWKEPLCGAEKKHVNTRLVQAVDTNGSYGERPTNRAITKDAVGSVDTHKQLSFTKSRSLTKAFAASEIMEVGSPVDPEWSSLARSSRGSRDEDDYGLDDQGRFSDRWLMWDSATESAEDKFGQSQPFANWLRKGRLPATKIKYGDEHGLLDKGLFLEGLCTPRNVKSTSVQDISFKKQTKLDSHWGNHKPLADWLHCEPSPAITFQLLEEATLLGKADKPKIMKPPAEKSKLMECRARVAHPLSKRTQYVKKNGMV